MAAHGCADVLSVEFERAAVAIGLAGDDFDERRFACAVAAQKRVHFACGD
ncbi:hypothetical protein HDG37_001983 [Paraburkholderia sp. MM5384-R2]|nr:hypothetical protein [Paraburkholderia sp. MM5384-R2]